MLLFLFAEASPIFELFAEQGRSMLRPCGRRIPRDFPGLPCTLLAQPVKLTLLHWCKGKRSEMLLARDFVAHMANAVVKRLVEGGQIETKAAAAVANRVRQRIAGRAYDRGPAQ